MEKNKNSGGIIFTICLLFILIGIAITIFITMPKRVCHIEEYTKGHIVTSYREQDILTLNALNEGVTINCETDWKNNTKMCLLSIKKEVCEVK